MRPKVFPQARTFNTRSRSSQTTGLKAIILDGWIAGVPFIASLIAVLFSASSDVVVRALVILMFVSSVVLLVKYFRSGFKNRGLASLAVVAGFVGWYSYPGLLLVLTPNPRFGDNLSLPIDNQTVVLSVLYLSLFLLTWSIVFNVVVHGRRSRPISTTLQVASTNKRTILCLALFGVILGLGQYLLSGLTPGEVLRLIFESRSAAKPWLFTENLGNRASAFVFLAQSILVASTCILWAATQDSSIRVILRLLFGTIALAITVIVFFDQGTRSITALILLPVLLIGLLKAWPRSRSSVLVGLLLVFLLILLFQFQLLFRTAYTRLDTASELLTDWSTFRGTSDYFSETLFAVKIIPAYHEYFRESVIVQFLASPIPRFLWAAKPATQVIWFYSLLRWGIDIYAVGGNTFPGIVGQFYMSWGWIGPVIIGAGFGWICARADAFLAKADPDINPYATIVGAMFAVWLLLSYRVLSPGFLYPVLFAALMLYLSREHASGKVVVARELPSETRTERLTSSEILGL